MGDGFKGPSPLPILKPGFRPQKDKDMPMKYDYSSLEQGEENR
jgi:hypothetical protein